MFSPEMIEVAKKGIEELEAEKVELTNKRDALEKELGLIGDQLDDADNGIKALNHLLARSNTVAYVENTQQY